MEIRKPEELCPEKIDLTLEELRIKLQQKPKYSNGRSREETLKEVIGNRYEDMKPARCFVVRLREGLAAIPYEDLRHLGGPVAIELDEMRIVAGA